MGLPQAGTSYEWKGCHAHMGKKSKSKKMTAANKVKVTEAKIVAEQASAPAATVEEKPVVVAAPEVKAEAPAPAKKPTAAKTEAKKKASPAKKAAKPAPVADKPKAKPGRKPMTAEEKAARAEEKAKAAAMKPAIFIQFRGIETTADELVERARAAFKAEHKRTAVEQIKVYVKPEDNAVYYVVNDKFMGKVDF